MTLEFIAPSQVWNFLNSLNRFCSWVLPGVISGFFLPTLVILISANSFIPAASHSGSLFVFSMGTLMTGVLPSTQQFFQRFWEMLMHINLCNGSKAKFKLFGEGCFLTFSPGWQLLDTIGVTWQSKLELLKYLHCPESDFQVKNTLPLNSTAH